MPNPAVRIEVIEGPETELEMRSLVDIQCSGGVRKPEHVLDIIYLAARLVMDTMPESRLNEWRRQTTSEILNL